MKCKRTSDGRAIDHHFLQVMRLQAIKAMREGQSAAFVATAFDINVRSVYRWLADFANGGQNALLAKPIPGRPPKVGAEEMRRLAQAIRAEARAAGATICFADESGIRADYHTGRTGAPRSQTPVVEVTGRRFSLNMISAVSPRGDFRALVHEGGVAATVFREFLKRLMIGADKPVFVIDDGHPIHKAKFVNTYVESLDGKPKLFYLPPYPPHLNPDEQVWAHVKRQVSREFVQGKGKMKRLAIGALCRIQRLPELVKSFFRQPECEYAAM